MNKRLVYTLVLATSLASCEKDPSSTKSTSSQGGGVGHPNGYAVGSYLSPGDTIGVDLTGFLLDDGADTVIAGSLAVSVNPAGDLTLVGVYNFSVRAASGQIYQGVYSWSAERTSIGRPMPTGDKAYYLSWEPQHGGADFTCYALAIVGTTRDGQYFISITHGLIEFH